MKIYRGYRRMQLDIAGKPTTRDCMVEVWGDGADGPSELSYLLPLRLDIRNHSPSGFEWGYGGSGPAQLALALVADCAGDELATPAIYQRVKGLLVARLPKDGWILQEDVVRQFIWLAQKQAKEGKS